MVPGLEARGERFGRRAASPLPPWYADAHSVAAAYVSWHAPASVASPRHGSASRAASVGHADSSAAIAGCEYSFAHAPNSRNRIALATRRISEAAFPAAAANDDDDEPAPASAHSALARATALATRRRANATAFAGSRTLATTRARPSTTHARGPRRQC